MLISNRCHSACLAIYRQAGYAGVTPGLSLVHLENVSWLGTWKTLHRLISEGGSHCLLGGLQQFSIFPKSLAWLVSEANSRSMASSVWHTLPVLSRIGQIELTALMGLSNIVQSRLKDADPSHHCNACIVFVGLSVICSEVVSPSFLVMPQGYLKHVLSQQSNLTVRAEVGYGDILPRSDGERRGL